MAALAPVETWEVRIPVHRGPDLPPVVLSGEVRGPTVAEALAVLSGDALAAARSWLPPRLYSEVRALSEEARQTLLARLLALASGDPPPEAKDGTASAEHETVHDALFGAVLDVAIRFGSYDAALALPWAAFLRMGERLRRARASESLERATAARVGYHADADAWKAYTHAMGRLSGAITAVPLTPEERAAAKAQGAYVQAQAERFKRTGSTLPQTPEEREADARRLAEMSMGHQGEA